MLGYDCSIHPSVDPSHIPLRPFNPPLFWLSLPLSRPFSVLPLCPSDRGPGPPRSGSDRQRRWLKVEFHLLGEANLNQKHSYGEKDALPHSGFPLQPAFPTLLLSPHRLIIPLCLVSRLPLHPPSLLPSISPDSSSSQRLFCGQQLLSLSNSSPEASWLTFKAPRRSDEYFFFLFLFLNVRA